MIKYLSAMALVLCTVSAAMAQGNSITQQVGVCDARPGAGANCVRPSSGGNIPVAPGSNTIVALDVATVTTGGVAVTALIAGHRSAGGFLTNPKGATIDLCINEQAAASGTTSAGGLTCISPGQSYTLAPSAAAVSVVTSDSSHPFSGYGLN